MQKIDQLLVEHKLQHKKEMLVKAAAPSIGIKKEIAKEETIAIGRSKFGGLPDLPAHFTFPQFAARHLSFIAQINLQEAKSFDENNELPETGILYFFYDVIEQPWGLDKEDKGCFKVLYFDGDMNELKRTPYPEETEDYFPLPVFKISFKEMLTFSENPEGVALDDDEADHFYEFRDSSMQLDLAEGLAPAMHYMLGQPFNVQGDVFEEIIYYEHDEKIDWGSEEMKDSGKEMLLLFQMDSDDDMELMWGDCGILYFCINADDLRNKRFDRTKFTMQCS